MTQDRNQTATDHATPVVSLACALCDLCRGTHAVGAPGRRGAQACAGARISAALPGEVVVAEDDGSMELMALLDGVAMTQMRLADGRRLVTGFRLAGEQFLLGGASPVLPISIEAITPVTLCRVGGGALERLRGQPGVERLLSDLIGAEIATSSRHMIRLGRMSALERLASFIAELNGRLGRQVKDHWVVPLPMSRADIADHLGLTLETVSRSFSRLRSSGIVEQPKLTVLQVRDLEGLYRLCGCLADDLLLPQARVAERPRDAG